MNPADYEWKPVEVLPDGRLRLHVIYLEMRQRPKQAPPPPPDLHVHLMQAVRPTVSFYRYLYHTVGEPWLWSTYHRVGDEALRTILHDANTEVHVLYADGVPAGYAHLDFRGMPDVELLFFGLIPEFIGRRLGPVLLHHAIERVWDRGATRFWLHTCSGDHPKAVSVYRRAGFVPYRTETRIIDDPRPHRRPEPDHA